MKELLKEILLICFLVVVISCNDESKKEEKYTIKGEVTGFADSTTFYLKNLSTDAVFDSAVVMNNRFEFKGKLAETPELVWLNTRIEKEFIYTTLLMTNDEINIEGDISDFPWNVTVSGSKVQEDYFYSRNITKEYDMRRDSLVQRYFSFSSEERSNLGAGVGKEIRRIDSITTSLRIEYIKSHSNTFSSIIELGYLKNKIPKDTIHKIFNNFTPKIKHSKYAKIVDVFLKENISKIGDRYHDFEGFNQRDETVKFSDIRGQYSLIDFTAAYCGPCIQAAEELVEINNVYSDILSIISFSGDPKKDVWLKSLERDKVTWTSIWDGKGRYSETAIKYGVQGFPTFVLIDPEGIIIDKWTGYGKGSLNKRLGKHFLELKK